MITTFIIILLILALGVSLIANWVQYRLADEQTRLRESQLLAKLETEAKAKVGKK